MADRRAAYVHIPFCRRRCPYCDFAVVELAEHQLTVPRYVDALLVEIGMERAWEPLHAVNFGGGTPSALGIGQIERILEALSNRFGIHDDAEVSIEANPEDWVPEYAAALRQIGVNRVSLGVQSFDSEVLQKLGRVHGPETATDAVESSVAAGFDNINLDLIFGTPGESLESWQETVAIAVGLASQHLSAYALTVELGTELSRAVSSGSPGPDEDDLADKYELLVTMLPARLIHYEVSNWAEAGKECRYNMTTWAQGEYIGFGLGAHGHRDGVRRRTVRRLDAYLSRIDEGLRPEAGAERLDSWEKEKERVFLGLRRRNGVQAGRAGGGLWESEAGQRFRRAGVIDLVAGQLVVLKPLLTDAVAREVLALNEP